MRPSTVEVLLSMAHIVSSRSTCSRRHNGAVIATEKGVVLSTGYNGSLSGMPHCNHESNPEETGCTVAVHAEANAVYFAARHGVSVAGAVIYCTTEPCVKCAEAIVQSGISTAYYDQEYRNHDGIRLLEKANVKVVQHRGTEN